MKIDSLNHIALLKTIVFLLCILCPLLGYAQKVETDTTEEKIDEESFKTLKSGYNYIIQAEEEELSMFKVDLLSPFFYPLNDWDKDSTAFDFLRLSFEHKWKPNWSWVTGLDLEGDGSKVSAIGVWGGVRYYYNMNKRILKGKSANNFSADYLGLSLINRYEPPEKDMGLSINAVYGLQRRLGKLGYLNFEIGLENILDPTSKTEGGIDGFLDLQIGLAF